MAVLQVVSEGSSVDQRCHVFQTFWKMAVVWPWPTLAKLGEGEPRGKESSKNMQAGMTSWVLGRELSGQGPICPGQCQGKPWCVRVPGGPNWRLEEETFPGIQSE